MGVQRACNSGGAVLRLIDVEAWNGWPAGAESVYSSLACPAPWARPDLSDRVYCY